MGIVRLFNEIMTPAMAKRFEDALASGSLRQLSAELSAEGLSQAAIYHQFESFADIVERAGRTVDESELYFAMECIVGYCTPSNKWFDHYLTNEEIYAYRSSLAEPGASVNAG